ncbi:hypothetical protein ACFPRL_34210 [Pseudoclavibacter helvolus]
MRSMLQRNGRPHTAVAAPFRRGVRRRRSTRRCGNDRARNSLRQSNVSSEFRSRTVRRGREFRDTQLG